MSESVVVRRVECVEWSSSSLSLIHNLPQPLLWTPSGRACAVACWVALGEAGRFGPYKLMRVDLCFLTVGTEVSNITNVALLVHHISVSCSLLSIYNLPCLHHVCSSSLVSVPSIWPGQLFPILFAFLLWTLVETLGHSHGLRCVLKCTAGT